MLRGINVSGQKKIKMADLRALYESLGFDNVQSYLQSGNVIFDSSEGDRTKLAMMIEDAIHNEYGYEVAIFIRTVADFQQIIDTNPFLHGRDEDPTKLYVSFLMQRPSDAKLSALTVPEKSADEFVVAGDVIFVFCPNGYGRTKLSNNFFERKLQVAATTRNWRSVNALLEIAIG